MARSYESNDERWATLIDAVSAFSCYAARGDFDGMCVCRKVAVKMMDGLLMSESLRKAERRDAASEQVELTGKIGRM